MAARHRPGMEGAPQPLEDISLQDFKVSPENLDLALKVLKQVLQEGHAQGGDTHERPR